MSKAFLFSFFVPLVGMMMTVLPVGAGEHCCDKCGCDQECQKVCRLVREEKKVEVICYGGKKVDFCLPTPSKRGCKHKDTVCDPCDEKVKDDDVQSKSHKFVWFDWFPGCAKMHTKTVLMKRTETKTIPTFKWVVEDLCESCKAAQKTAENKSAAEADPVESELVPATAQTTVAPPVNSTRIEAVPALETPARP